ncbi:MAG TPA: GTP cyclohydrolase I FolE [Candidatus Saccharimonadales bacterium]|jgi:GTP cyclohydrolase IA|nr:GTP cyclohydrolase I FolE [Candidatus Saccharimonadales bacterium]
MEKEVRKIIQELGEDPTRVGLEGTPKRVEKALKFLTRGYTQDIDKVINGAIFPVDHNEMVLIKDIEIYSLCEHHMLPFAGKAHVAYIPDGKVIGLSKIARVVDLFARRLQMQERLTNQIANALNEKIMPKAVGVIIEAEHFCIMMRGAEKQHSKMVTSAMRGRFLSDIKSREEFLNLVKG